ncbi:uncharacterized protein LOC126965807 [Leptidea sinapis]|uniref:uncharacterized protein LOC126965807 n=1 Tax=Leptidea sinapis TaxID=189913 RepID=UPI00211F62D7|nr:uncharacterized protein LOC126965807 [Leptidea sinapis]
MFKLILLSALLAVVPAAEIQRLSDKHVFDVPQALETHPVHQKAVQEEQRPIYRKEGAEGRRIEPERPMSSLMKHENMLADEPASISSASENHKSDIEPVSGFAYNSPVEVAYPDIPYAPGYNYGHGYAGNGYDGYGNSLSDYLLEPDTSSFGLMWSQVPDSRTLVSYVGRTIGWIFNSIFVILLGSLLTVGVCTYTNLCSITFNGVGPIHEEMRSLITPDRLEKISTAADFVKTAINKYQKIQKVNDAVGARRRRAINMF